MSYATYFPEQRHALSQGTIRRERLLPEGAVGELEVQPGERVDLRDVVARGALPSRYLILDAAAFFRARKPEQVESLLLVQAGDYVEEGQALAGKSAERGKRLFSPVSGQVVHTGEGRIILRELPMPIEVQASLNGQVVGTRDERGVIIETSGAVLQGVWGNNKVTIGTLRPEPEEGLENLAADVLGTNYRGVIFITRQPLTARALDTMERREVSGVVAPGMDALLRERAMQLQTAIMLTFGFGSSRMSQFVHSFLDGLVGKQATLDATQPDRFNLRRPELIVNLPSRSGQRPPAPPEDAVLREGSFVRLTRGQYAEMVGQVVDLPKAPYLLDNGLRLPCAQIQLTTGETVFVPLANLEVFGQ